MFPGASPYSDYVDTTFLVVTGISLLVLIGVLIVMVWFVIRYSRKRNPHSTNIEGNIPLEITWTVIPLILFMGMFYMGWKGYLMERDIPDDAVPIKATARMWAWTFEYPNGVTTDTMYVPVGVPIKVTLHSQDVNHAMYIPDFRVKKDVVPNRTNDLWFATPRVGSHDIACAEYCGLNHAYMYTKVVSMDTTAFDDWYRAISDSQSKPYRSILEREPKQ